MTEYPLTTWRLLNTQHLDGATNMAIDEAISRAVKADLVPPTLRFFGWQPACLSLGQAQPGGDVDQAACRSAGVDVVRRPTGGRAILHTDELTYSVIAPEREPRVAGTIVESYKRLSEGLLNGLMLIGVPTRQVERPDERDRDQGPVCFEVPSNYEIVFDGKKLVGSAQMRKAGVVLQHGTIPLHGDIARISLRLPEKDFTIDATAWGLPSGGVPPVACPPFAITKDPSGAARRLMANSRVSAVWTNALLNNS